MLERLQVRCDEDGPARNRIYERIVGSFCFVPKKKHGKAVRKHVRVDRPSAAGTLFPSCALDLDNKKMVWQNVGTPRCETSR